MMGRGYENQTRKMLMELQKNANAAIKNLTESMTNITAGSTVMANKLEPYLNNDRYWRNKCYEWVISELLQWNQDLEKQVKKLEKRVKELETPPFLKKGAMEWLQP